MRKECQNADMPLINSLPLHVDIRLGRPLGSAVAIVLVFQQKRREERAGRGIVDENGEGKRCDTAATSSVVQKAFLYLHRFSAARYHQSQPFCCCCFGSIPATVGIC